MQRFTEMIGHRLSLHAGLGVHCGTSKPLVCKGIVAGADNSTCRLSQPLLKKTVRLSAVDDLDDDAPWDTTGTWFHTNEQNTFDLEKGAQVKLTQGG